MVTKRYHHNYNYAIKTIEDRGAINLTQVNIGHCFGLADGVFRKILLQIFTWFWNVLIQITPNESAKIISSNMPMDPSLYLRIPIC